MLLLQCHGAPSGECRVIPRKVCTVGFLRGLVSLAGRRVFLCLSGWRCIIIHCFHQWKTVIPWTVSAETISYSACLFRVFVRDFQVCRFLIFFVFQRFHCLSGYFHLGCVCITQKNRGNWHNQFPRFVFSTDESTVIVYLEKSVRWCGSSSDTI